MIDPKEINNFESYKNETDEIHWFLEKDDENQQNIKLNECGKNATRTIVTITSLTDKGHIKNLIKTGVRIFMIKGALFKAEDYLDIMKRITMELEKTKESPTFIFDLQGPVPVISNLYQKGEKKEKLTLRAGQLIKITNKNMSNKNCDTIVIDKRIYSTINKGNSILFDTNMILNIISQENCHYENESTNNSSKEVIIKRENRFKTNKSEKNVSITSQIQYVLDKVDKINDENKHKTEKIERISRKTSYTIDEESSLIANLDNKASKNMFKPSLISNSNLSDVSTSTIPKQFQKGFPTADRRLASSQSKNKTINHPELLIDFNQGEILKNKQNTLNNEYKKIIKSQQFLSEIKEHDELTDRPFINKNFKEKEFFSSINDQLGNFEEEDIETFKFKNEDHVSITLKNQENINCYGRCSLKDRQILLKAGYRFTNIMKNPILCKKTTSPKKVIVCEVEAPGEVHLLSETYTIGDKYKNTLPTLGPKDITDISRSIQLNVSIFSATINKSSDIKEIRKIINEDPYSSNDSKDEDNPEYRKYLAHRIKIFAKILTNTAIMNFDDILAEADGIILDPSVLSNNIGYDDLCLIETYIIEKCKLTNKPIYFKTNCFNTLHCIKIPSVTDISNLNGAITSGIDGFILSEYFPSEAFIKLQKIITEMENLVDGKSKYEEISKSVKCNIEEIAKSHSCLKSLNTFHLIETLFDSSVKITFEIPISLIFLYCDSYLSAKRLSRYRPNCRIICPTNNRNEYNFMRVFRGVSGYFTTNQNFSCYNESLQQE